MESFLNGKIELHIGNCMDVLPTLPENSIDSCVTDPPYHLVSIIKRFGKPAGNFGNGYGSGFDDKAAGVGGAMARLSRGFMGKQWDGGDVAFRPETWAEVYRVLKPGAHLLAFGGTRTYHRMACAIEDAAFEVRDCIQWLYGSGFPKSHDVSKGIDRAAGAKRELIRRGKWAGREGTPSDTTEWRLRNEKPRFELCPVTEDARQWEGWGTALKPACEPIVLARKPLSEKTVAANVLKWGTGAINVDGCRVGTAGRWPANVIHDGSDEVLAGFPDAPGQGGSVSGGEPSSLISNVYGQRERRPSENPRDDSGSAASFFYTAKADSDDRIGSRHPTVKPLDLMQYLVRLVTPKGGTVIDPFAGSGTTGEAAWREGMKAVLIEREAEYQTDIRRRVELCMAGPDERSREMVKARGLTESPGPLFDEPWDDMWRKPFDRPKLVWGKDDEPHG